MARYQQTMRSYFSEAARDDRLKSLAAGIKRYEWLAVDVHGVCETAKRNGGKVFDYASPPPGGHVGEGECSSPDWCRCVAAPIVTLD